MPPNKWHPELFRRLFETCRAEPADGIGLMLCHRSLRVEARGGEPLVCQGWARAEGYDALGVRIALLRGQVTKAEVTDTKGPPLWTFEEMMKANGWTIEGGRLTGYTGPGVEDSAWCSRYDVDEPGP